MNVIPDGWILTDPDSDGHRYLLRKSDDKKIVASTDPIAWAVQISDFEFLNNLVESQKPYNKPSGE